MVNAPTTPALRVLRSKGVPHDLHPYPYRDGGGTGGYARATGVDEHIVVKTLVMDGDAGPLVVLMHGDAEVSTRSLARHLGVKHVGPAEPAVAERLTGYRVGGMSPFGTRRRLPVVCQSTVLDEPVVHVNAGRRGLLVSLSPHWFVELLDADAVDVTA
jgi:Cys-tRNA(Pro) deacylase